MTAVRGALAVLGATLALGVTPYRTAANPVPADELSLLNGADYFERYCMQCHGWDPSQQYDSLYGEDPIDEPDPLLEIGAQEPAVDESPVIAAPEEDWPEWADPPLEEYDWPEWADPPPEDDEFAEEDLRDAVLSDLTSAIDEVYSEDVDPWGYELPGDEPDYGEDGYDEYYEDPAFESEALAGPAGGDSDPVLERAPGAPDLAEPDSYLYGTGETDLYTSIAHGTGDGMPGFVDELGSEEAVWDLVNYIRSLWGEDRID